MYLIQLLKFSISPRTSYHCQQSPLWDVENPSDSFTFSNFTVDTFYDARKFDSYKVLQKMKLWNVLPPKIALYEIKHFYTPEIPNSTGDKMLMGPKQRLIIVKYRKQRT